MISVAKLPLWIWIWSASYSPLGRRSGRFLMQASHFGWPGLPDEHMHYEQNIYINVNQTPSPLSRTCVPNHHHVAHSKPPKRRYGHEYIAISLD